MHARTTGLLITVVFLTACQLPEGRVDITSLAYLEPIENCDSVLSAIKLQAIEEMEAEVNANLESVLDGDYCYDYDDWGRGVSDTSTSMDGGAWDTTETGTEPPGDVPGEEAGEYSETNNQVAGVDEADFIKNDGGHIYILADGRLQIIDSWPASESRVIGSFDIEGEPQRLFVHEDRAVVYSAVAPATDDPYYPGYGSGDCTYGYDCEFTGDGRPTKITVLDISDLENPTLIRETWFSGSYINSRRIGKSVYTIVNFPEISFPRLDYWPDDLGDRCVSRGTFREGVVRLAFRRLKEENRQVIEETRITDWIPSVTDAVHTPAGTTVGEGLLDSCDNFYESSIGDGHSLLSIVAFDMGRQDSMNMTTIVGKPGAVYASADALYVASRHNASDGSWYFGDDGSVREATTVHKFDLLHETSGAFYAATGVVKGRVLNQFSMDEYDGHLRIATTMGRVPNPDVHSTISVLGQQQGVLGLVGQIDDIAPTEDIRSVRFNGEQGYIVTFKKTDPLFVLDLANPRHPLIKGELKIPGFSTYMHMIDDSHIMSIGYDAEDHDTFAYFQGIQLQIMDVTDLENPTLIHKEVIGTRGSTSDAATDHLAFNFFASRDLLAIPMVICEASSGGGGYGVEMTFAGLLVYRVTTEAGFEPLGGVDHMDSIDTSTYTCSNWWTRSNSNVKRSIFMEDFVYSVAPELIKVDHLDTLGTDVAVIDLID